MKRTAKKCTKNYNARAQPLSSSLNLLFGDVPVSVVVVVFLNSLVSCLRRDGAREGGRERGSEGGRERGREGERERGSEGGRELGGEEARKQGSKKESKKEGN